MNSHQHVAQVMAEIRDSMFTWARDLTTEAGIPIEPIGEIPKSGKKPRLVLLPYQMVMESQAGVPTISLMPMLTDSKREAIPKPWRTVAVAMTNVLVEQFPQRKRKSAGIGPLDPCPPLDGLPSPVRAWYKANAEEWILPGGKRGLLPHISWRQPFSLSIRYAAMVVDPSESPGLDLTQLQTLSVLATGIRQQRYFRSELPAVSQPESLQSLVDAMIAATPETERGAFTAAAEQTRQSTHLAVGMFPHKDLSDNDIAMVMRALRLPMQPTLIFGVRLALGAGPELGAGAMPHLSPAGKLE